MLGDGLSDGAGGGLIGIELWLSLHAGIIPGAWLGGEIQSIPLPIFLATSAGPDTIYSMKTVRARFDGHVLVPEEPVVLPIGPILELHYEPVELTADECARANADLADFAEQLPSNPDAPVDGAEQHDHYLYGTPKRS
jgi:hypothetical protein